MMHRRDLCRMLMGLPVLLTARAAAAQERRDREWREYCGRLNGQREALNARIERSRGPERERLERWRREVYEREVEYCRGEHWRR